MDSLLCVVIIFMCSNKPDISYKPEVYMLHIPTHLQVYMCKYTSGGTCDVGRLHSIRNNYVNHRYQVYLTNCR